MTRCITCDCRLGDGWCHACAEEANKGAQAMSEIEITDDLLDEIEAKAKAATQARWVANGRYIGTPNHMSLIGECRDQNGNWSDTSMSSGNSNHTARMDPPTALALVAEVRRLREQLKIADEQAAALEGVASSATRWDGAKYSSLELAARRQALEEADEIIRLEIAGRPGCDRMRASIRALKDKEPGQ